jgi:hypothetical protein
MWVLKGGFEVLSYQLMLSYQCGFGSGLNGVQEMGLEKNKQIHGKTLLT